MNDPLLRLEELSTRAPEALEVMRLGKSLAIAQDAAKNAPQDLARLSALLDCADLIGGGDNDTLKAAIDDALDKFDNVGALLAGAHDAKTLSDVEHDYKSLRTDLARLDRAVHQQWEARIQRDFASLRTVGGLLLQIPDAAALGKKMQALADQALQSRLRSAPAELLAEMRQVIDARARLNDERQTLLGEPALNAFLEAAAQGEATLANVTPGVLKRLKELNALAAFRVSA